MAILTKFLQLLKPEKNDYVDVEKHLSENYDKIDAKMEELSNSNDEKLNKGNVPDVLNSAEKIIKALQGNTGIKFDESLLYLNDSGTKKKGYCYIDKLTDGIFECIQETTTTVNNATYFKNFSNKENSDRLSNLGESKLIFAGEVNEEQTINFEDISKFRLLIFRNRTNASDTILYRNEFIKNTKFMISAISIDAQGFSFLQGIILNNTSAYIEKVVTNQVSIANHNHLKIVGVY